MSSPLRSGPVQSGNCQLEWLHYEIFGTSLKPNQTISVPIPGSLGHHELVQAIGLLIKRHEILRTTFGSNIDGDPVQHVWEAREITLHDLPGVCPEDDHGNLSTLINDRFAIEQDWPIRTAVVTREERHRELVLIMPHIAIDAVGARALRDDIEALFRQFLTSSVDPLEVRPYQPLDVARHNDPPASRDAVLEFWNERLMTMPGGIFPVSVIPDRVRRVRGEYRSSMAGRALEHCASRSRISANVILIAAISANIPLISGHAGVPMNLVWASRRRPDDQSVAGSFAKNLALSIDTGLDPRFHGLVREAFKTLVEAARYDRFDVLEFQDLMALASRARGSRIGSGIYANCLYESPGARQHGEPLTSYSREAGRPDLRELVVECPDEKERFSSDSCVLGLTARRTASGELGIWVNGIDAVFDIDSITALLEGIEDTIVGFAEDPEFRRPADFVSAEGAGMISRKNEWIDLKLIEEVLLSHPSVTLASVAVKAGVLRAAVELADPRIDSRDLRELLLAKLDNRHAIAVPDEFTIQRRLLPNLLHGTAAPYPAVSALCSAVADANRLSSVSPHRSYGEAGGQLKFVPKVLKSLEDARLRGLQPMDFLLPCDLESLASRLTAI